MAKCISHGKKVKFCEDCMKSFLVEGGKALATGVLLGTLKAIAKDGETVVLPEMKKK